VAIVLVSLRCDVGIIRTQYQCHQGKVSASSRHGVGVPPCHQDAMSVSSGCGVSVIGVQCWCHWDMVLASSLSGCSVGVEIVDAQGRSMLATVHSMPPPSRHTPPEHPQAAPKVHEGCRPLHQQWVTQCPALPLPLLLLCCHLILVEGIMTAALLMQKTLHRVPDADAMKSFGHGQSTLRCVGWAFGGSVAVVWGTSAIKRQWGRKRRGHHGHSCVAVRLAF